eukprot:553290_1
MPVVVSCIPTLRGIVRVGRSRTPWRRLCSSKNAPVEYADKPSGVGSSSTTLLADSGKPTASVSRAGREGSRPERPSPSLMQRTQAFIVGAGISLGVTHFLLNEEIKSSNESILAACAQLRNRVQVRSEATALLGGGISDPHIYISCLKAAFSRIR